MAGGDNSRVLDILRELRNAVRRGETPVIRNLMGRSKVKTTSSVSYHLQALVESGSASLEEHDKTTHYWPRRTIAWNAEDAKRMIDAGGDQVVAVWIFTEGKIDGQE